jgi:hypothetical protein
MSKYLIEEKIILEMKKKILLDSIFFLHGKRFHCIKSHDEIRGNHKNKAVKIA